MVKSILKSDLINYSENKEIDMEDIGYSTVIYEYHLYNRNIEIALGKIKHTYSNKNIIYYPIYLIIDDTPKSKIGIFEIKSENLIHNLEDDEVDLEQGEIIIFISNDMFNKIIGSQHSKNENDSEKINNDYEQSSDVNIDDILFVENVNETTKKDDIFLLEVQENKPVLDIKNEEIFLEDKSKEIEPLLLEETLDVSKNDNNDFKESVSNTWIENFMKNNHYSITDNEGSGDCFFAVIRDAYKNIGKTTTVEKLRLILINEVNEDIFNEYKQIYLNFDAIYKETEKEMKNIKTAILVLKNRMKGSEITKEDHKKLVTEVNELVKNHKTASIDKAQYNNLLQEFVYMKNIENLEDLKEFIKTSNYWADTWAITTIEKKLNIKIIILSEESYKNKDFDSVMMCGQINDKELEDKGIFEPDYYIVTGYTGNHYVLINYKNKSMLKFREVPYDIKTLIISKCLERNAGPYYIIKDFVEYKKKMGVNENGDKDENEYLKRDLYDKDIVFMFYDQSSPKAKPGKGSGEQISNNLITEYIELTKGKNKNWRRKLDDDWLAPFTIDDKRWLSVTHYVLGSQFKKGFPDFYHEFSLDSGSKIANDIDLVKIAGSKTGKTKEMELRKKEIVIDSDYYGYDKNSRYIQERKTALEAKFIQNADLKHILINTKNAKLNKFKRRANPEVDELLMKIRQAMQ